MVEELLVIGENQYRRVVTESEVFMMPAGFVVTKLLGRGAYGSVIGVKDTSSNNDFALKKIKRAFDNPGDAELIVRELQALQKFSHPHLLSLKHVLPPPSLSNFDDIFFITEVMDLDLAGLIATPQDLSVSHIQLIGFQILLGLQQLHHHGILHRDLKPQNIFINRNCHVRIGDFGLCSIDHAKRSKSSLTEYVVTRWYRAPELILCNKGYDEKIDIWSVGCIIVELFTRQALFTGSCYIDQIGKILKMFGKPKKMFIKEFITGKRARRFLYEAKCHEDTYVQHRLRDLLRVKSESFGRWEGDETVAFDFCESLLRWDPRKRLSAMEALHHGFMAGLLGEYQRNELDYSEDEYTDEEYDALCEKALVPDEHGFCLGNFHKDRATNISHNDLNKLKVKFGGEKKEFTPDMVRELLYREICKFNPDCIPVLMQRAEQGDMLIPLQEEELTFFDHLLEQQEDAMDLDSDSEDECA